MIKKFNKIKRSLWVKNFLKGYGSILSLFPPEMPPKILITTPNQKKAGINIEKSDAEALQKDWEAIGKDIWGAIGEYEESRK
jgi:hypothetical protein